LRIAVAFGGAGHRAIMAPAMRIANTTETRNRAKGPVGTAAGTRWLLILLVILLGGCGRASWNDPYPRGQGQQDIFYSSFDERPKHLDPARSYSANEYAFLAQIYEPPIQYHLLLRPYRLVPLSATEVPEPRYFDRDGNVLPGDAPTERIAYSDYLIRIRPGIRFQPHPAFARDADGAYLYHALG
jgi:oligopeptide transport system substrate-binding protein